MKKERMDTRDRSTPLYSAYPKQEKKPNTEVVREGLGARRSGIIGKAGGRGTIS